MSGARIREHREVLRLMQAKEWRAADGTCQRLIAQYPDFAAGWAAASHIAMAQGSATRGLHAIDNALRLEPSNAPFLMHRAQCLMALNRRAEAFAAADAAQACAPRDPAILDAAGTLYSYGKDQPRALLAYDQAIALAPGNAGFLYNRASVRRFMGDLAGAEDDYDQVIALKPTDYEAYKNRSDLRIQSLSRNHVIELQALASQPIADWRGEVQVGYALAKEYEDLGEYAKSFDQLTKAASRQRAHIKYDVANDVATVQWIIDAFPRAPAATRDASPDAPIFVVGLPRSGTTLVERILSSHSQVFSAGELDCFAMAIVAEVRRRSGRTQMSRQELVAQSAASDFAALGRDYLQRAHAVSNGQGRFIDKMPLNYLYCGLILRALPHAKIVHLTRHPMAVCYAMYKTLFTGGYPFSYDLGEIGSYYVGYRRLMAHWQSVMPDALYELSYENLVLDQLGETRKLLDFCGLDWQDACAHFQNNPAASTTASAVQVRRPIYETSLAQWRQYEMQLAQLQDQLRTAGINVNNSGM